MKQIIIPKIYTENIEYPLIFLAGPIGSAPEWQDQATRFIFSQEKDATVVNPRRYVSSDLIEYLAKGDNNFFSRQRAMERHYLDLASKKGVIMFWLPGEEKHKCEKVYGAMTRYELAQWSTRYSFDNSLRICIGTDGKFPEMRTIAYDLGLDAPKIKIRNTLEETCNEAIKIAKGEI